MGIRFERQRSRTPVARDLTCPECDRPLEWRRRERGDQDQLVQVHLRYSCTVSARAGAGSRPAA